jgi:polyisoprenoid-binding protein YceI
VACAAGRQSLILRGIRGNAPEFMPVPKQAKVVYFFYPFAGTIAKRVKASILVISMSLLPALRIFAQEKFATENGFASFYSEAPIADVDARNRNVTVTLNTSTQEIVVEMDMADFHFKNKKMERDARDKYLETEKYSRAGFKGGMHGKIDYEKPGTYPATAVGTLTVHGVDKQVEKKGEIIVAEGKITLRSEFFIALQDYNIETPSILGIKMTQDKVLVKVEATLSEAKDIITKKDK